MKIKILPICRADSQEGFALITALLIMVLMTSLGLLVFSLTSRDLITSAKFATEKKSFSAAEHGVAQVLMNFAPGTSNAANANDPTTWPQVDNTTDPGTRFYYSIPATTDAVNVTSCPPPAGFNAETATGLCYNVDVRGANVNFVSQQQLLVGVRVGSSGSSSSAEQR